MSDLSKSLRAEAKWYEEYSNNEHGTKSNADSNGLRSTSRILFALAAIAEKLEFVEKNREGK